MRENITTSDIKIEIKNACETLESDYPMQLHLKLYMNRLLTSWKTLDNVNRCQFDIADIEKTVQQKIAAVVGEKLYEEKLYEIQKQTAAVCVVSDYDKIKYLDLKNFSISEDEKICKLVNNHHCEF